METQRPGKLRAADADREAVAEVLRTAAGDGRLDPGELDERLTAAYAARTYADLEPLVADLPSAGLPWSPTAPPDDERPLVVSAGSSSTKRRGAWRVPPRIVAEPTLSTVTLDFRSADCPHARVELEVRGGVGDVLLILPDGWSVDARDLRSKWGTTRNRHEAPPAPGKPTIVVTGGVGVGSLTTRGGRFYDR